MTAGRKFAFPRKWICGGAEHMQPRLVHHSTPQPHLPLDAFENWMEFFLFFFYNQGILVHYNRNVFWEDAILL